MNHSLAYLCPRCHEELGFHHVLAMTRQEMVVRHCAPETFRIRYQYNTGAILRLFGNLRPVFPYSAAETPTLPQPSIDAWMTHCREEWDTIETPEDFESACKESHGA